MLQLPCLAAVVVALMASCASGDTGKRAENSFHEFSERVKVAVTPGAVQRVGEFLKVNILRNSSLYECIIYVACLLAVLLLS